MQVIALSRLSHSSVLPFFSLTCPFQDLELSSKRQKLPEHFLFELLYTVNCWVSSSFKKIFLLKTKKHWYLVKITKKHASNSPVTFVTHKRFAVLLFLPSCCVNSLIMPITRPYSLWNLRNYLSMIVTVSCPTTISHSLYQTLKQQKWT